MKTVVLGITLLNSLFSTCQAQKRIVGEIIDGKNVITVSKDSLLKIGNKILKNQNVDGILTAVSIEQDVIENTKDFFYFLKFTSIDNSIKLVQLLSQASPPTAHCHERCLLC